MKLWKILQRIILSINSPQPGDGNISSLIIHAEHTVLSINSPQPGDGNVDIINSTTSLFPVFLLSINSPQPGDGNLGCCRLLERLALQNFRSTLPNLGMETLTILCMMLFCCILSINSPQPGDGNLLSFPPIWPAWPEAFDQLSPTWGWKHLRFACI